MEGMGCVEVATACDVGGWYRIANRGRGDGEGNIAVGVFPDNSAGRLVVRGVRHGDGPPAGVVRTGRAEGGTGLECVVPSNTISRHSAPHCSETIGTMIPFKQDGA